MNYSKKLLSTIFAVCMIFCFTVTASAAKKIVAVMPLENVAHFGDANVAEIMTEKLIVALQNSGRYSVIERTQLATIMREQGFQNIASDSAVELGKFTGANYLLLGKVTMATVSENPIKGLFSGSASGFVNGVKGKVGVDIRFVNAETGELIFAKNFEGDKSGKTVIDAINGSCVEVADNFLKELTSNVRGRVADVSGGEFYIDLGSDSGFKKGDTIIIERETSPIEINGKIVGMKTIQIGKAKITEVNAEYSVCKVSNVQKGQAIRKGDVVKRG